MTDFAAAQPVSGPLADLCADLGVAVRYWSNDGKDMHVSRATLLKILAAMEVDLGEDPDDGEIRAAHAKWIDSRWRRMLPAAVVVRRGRYSEVVVRVPDGTSVGVTAVLDGGDRIPLAQVEHNVPVRVVDGVRIGEAAFAVPADLPLGWHTIVADNEGDTQESVLAVTPERLSTADRFLKDPAVGVMAQLYSVRSQRSWGIGDLTTLGDLCGIVARDAGADFVLINPLHAAQPTPPVEDSPYLPTTRRYVNPIYVRIEAIEEYAYLDDADTAELHALAADHRALNSSAEQIHRGPVYAAKLRALHALHQVERSGARQADLERYIAEQGRGLRDFASWCADYEIEQRRNAGAPGTADDPFVEFADPLSAHADIGELREELIDFHCWVQWICDGQLADAQRAATDAGMRIGVMADLAVGVHPGGSDAANLAPWLAPDASVGAPPDGYNQHGQDWSQPPWDPHKLADAAYLPWRDMLRTILRHSGGIRVDHILGMFRLWWMPRMESPLNGTYVTYDHEAMVGILALEAELAGAVVIGEDLGTFEPWVQDYLAERGVMGTSVLWFESDGDQPKRPEDYRPLCLASVGTHDLPPTAGYLAGEHIALRERLGLLLTDAEEEYAGDLEWILKVCAAAADRGCFAGTSAEGVEWRNLTRDGLPDIDAILVGLHRFQAQVPSALRCISLVDMVGDRRTQNQPGTVHEQYPNWCIPLTDGDGEAVIVQDLPGIPLFHAIAAAAHGK